VPRSRRDGTSDQVAARAARDRARRPAARDPRGRTGVPARARGARHHVCEARTAPLLPLSGDAFVSIDREPIAAASIAQIHKALLRDGHEVVVKVRRPGVLEQAQVDLQLLRATADFIERRSATARLLQLSALAEEVEHYLRAELDFTEEAYNAELIARIVGDSPYLLVPTVVRELVTEEVLVL
jgi:predicted unusual protein kinase regulating ubiquinone biosynthesis (AarF/ABC1/UbiB family)